MEIDESKFGKSTYHQDKRVDGVWVSGGIKRKIKKSVSLLMKTEVPTR